MSLTHLECEYCGRWIEKTDLVIINEIHILTKDDIKMLRIDDFLNQLQNWCDKKMYHLSASQIMLLRPDIVGEFAREMTNDDGIWLIHPLTFCQSCYNKYWVPKYPVK